MEGEQKRNKKTMPLGVSCMISQVLYRAAQDGRGALDEPETRTDDQRCA